MYLAEQVVKDGEGDEGGNRIKRAVKMLRGGATNDDKVRFELSPALETVLETGLLNGLETGLQTRLKLRLETGL